MHLESKHKVKTDNKSTPDFSARAGGSGPRSALIEKLRTDIRAIEQHSRSFSPSPNDLGPAASACFFSKARNQQEAQPPHSPPSHQPSEDRGGVQNLGPAKGRWTFGVPEIDGMLPWIGLKPSGLHEIKPLHYRDMAAARSFALALFSRHRQIRKNAPVLWCLSDASSREFGTPYGPGLLQLGLDPQDLVMAQSKKMADLFWTMEEGLRAETLTAVLGEVDTAPFTEARRLALAAETHQIPCLLISHQETAGANVALTRWRISTADRASATTDPEALAMPRWNITLERTRHGPSGLNWTVEWSHEALCFRLVTPLADRTPKTGNDRYRVAAAG